jgi:hypothetical protein
VEPAPAVSRDPTGENRPLDHPTSSGLWCLGEPFFWCGMAPSPLSEPSPCSWSKEMSLQHLEVRPPERGIEDALTPGDSLNTVLIDGHLAR